MSEMDVLFPIPDGRRNADDMGNPPNPIAAQPDDVDALIEQIHAFLADAPKGKPHEGYRYGELLSFAADALRRERERANEAWTRFVHKRVEWRAAVADRDRLAAEVERLTVNANGMVNDTRKLLERAEKAEAEVERLRADAESWTRLRKEWDAVFNAAREGGE